MTQPTPPGAESPETEPEQPLAPLTQEQHDQIGAQMLASARRLATDPEHLKAILETAVLIHQREA